MESRMDTEIEAVFISFCIGRTGCWYPWTSGEEDSDYHDIGRFPEAARGILSLLREYLGVSQNYGYLLGGPHNKDYRILVYIGVPLFWETTIH